MCAKRLSSEHVVCTVLWLHITIYLWVSEFTCQLLSNLHVVAKLRQDRCKAHAVLSIYALQLLCVYCTIYMYTKYDMTSHCRAPKRGVGVILVLKMNSILGRSAPSLYTVVHVGTCTCIYIYIYIYIYK